MGGQGSGAKPKRYDPALVEQVRTLYESGLTMREVADVIGTSVKVLQVLMPRYGIARRPATKRDQSGAANHAWRGAAAGYKALHLRVATVRGKPSRCAACERTDDEYKYEWASLTKDYANVYDYVRLCVPCHRRFDGRRAADRR